MLKNCWLLLFLFCLTQLNGFGQYNNASKDTIIQEFLKGALIIIDNWALAGPKYFFDSVKISEDSYKAKLLEPDTAILKYGYFGKKYRIYEMSIPSIDSITSGYYIDKQILKFLDPEKKIFYYINGAPCWDYENALDLLINRKILKIQQIDANQATAIWGAKDGKNGALLINTDKQPKTILIIK
jgi:hypothetical protein